jgi:hypothetical protein
MSEIELLGYRISDIGSYIGQDKVQSILEWHALRDNRKFRPLWDLQILSLLHKKLVTVN